MSASAGYELFEGVHQDYEIRDTAGEHSQVSAGFGADHEHAVFERV